MNTANPTTLQPFSLTECLGVQGWSHLDAVILAALATQSPVLLVGMHGTAKSLLIERLAMALELNFRHFNASLVNYDDLVGIPLPDASGERLRFVSTPGSIWDGEFVFFDEISRCRPDLQNKLFPIIHERRIAGLNLEKLQHCWSAMNPPAPDDIVDNSSTYYLGSEQIDPALADRFPFIILVPNWKELSKLERHRLLTEERSSSLADGQLSTLVQQCTAYIADLEPLLSERLADYILCLMDLLDKATLMQSPRRARMMMRSVLAVHAARRILEGQDIDFATSAEIALLNGLPQTATELPPSPAAVLAAHRQAWEVSGLIKDDLWRQVLEEQDPVKRIWLADRLNLSDENISKLVTQGLGAIPSDARQLGVGVTVFLAFHARRDLTPAAWGLVSSLVHRVLEPRTMSDSIPPGPVLEIWREINTWLATQGDTAKNRLERNYLLGGFPDLWKRYPWQSSLDQFRDDLKLFEVSGDSL